ncbi:serine/threonine-protein kinase [Streptomyces sp. NPDC003077]|uniref:serine/threonine-protein kinase n=1 Tax=Streptomyces sp. NPDC003077 TaxID=3154443 RepID=UPI0033A7926B
MGRVWRARDETLDRWVAVKEIRIDELAGEEGAIQRERSLREARATARIDHPNVVRVYDVAEEGDRLWIVMQLVPSRSLEQVLVQDGPLTLVEAARIGRGLVRALREVHAVGVLHRDIKPGNVLIDDRGGVVLTDFGIAAVQDAAALTMAGMLIGSPDYMAPERVEGRTQGPPSDLWSLGATLCAALVGESPFSRGTTLATLHAVLYEEPQIPPAAGPMTGILTALFRKTPEDRPDLAAVEAALAPLAEPVPDTAAAPAPSEPPQARTPTVTDVPAGTTPGWAEPEPPEKAEDAYEKSGGTAGREGTADETDKTDETAAGTGQATAPERERTAPEAAPTGAPAEHDATVKLGHRPPTEPPSPPPEPAEAATPEAQATPPKPAETPETPELPATTTAPTPRRPPRSRRGKRTALAALAATLVAGAAVAGILVTQDDGRKGAPPAAESSGPQSPPTRTEPSAGTTTPRGERRTEDGFSWVPPAGWNRTAESPSDVTYSTTDGAVLISARQNASSGGDLLAIWRQYEREQHDVPGYRKIRLERSTFQGHPAVVWEFAYLRDGDKPAHGRQLGFRTKYRTYQLNVWYLDSVEAPALRAYERVKASFRTS